MDDTTNTVTDDSASTASDGTGTSLLTDTTNVQPDATTTATTTEAAATGENAGEKPAADSADKDKPDGPPEKYEFSAPEGVELDAAALEKFEPLARELGLTQEQANKLVALQAELVAQQQTNMVAMREAWKSESENDKEIGGDAFKPSMKAAQQALSKFGTPELRAALDATGMGNHPELVRLMARVGKAMADDSFIKGDAPVGDKSPADRLFGKPTT